MEQGFALKGCAVGSAAVCLGPDLAFSEMLQRESELEQPGFQGSSRNRDKLPHAHVHASGRIGL